MKHTFALLLLLAVIFFLPVSLAAQNDSADGNKLILSCKAAVEFAEGKEWKSGGEAFDMGFCLGLVEGVAFSSPEVCTSSDVTHGQGARVVLKYLNDHPEKLSLRRDRLVEAALAQAFPCEKHAPWIEKLWF
jgi:hypothetical protein